MAPTFIQVTNSEIQTIVSRFSSNVNGVNGNTVHVHCAMQSLMTFVAAPAAFVSSVTPANQIQINGKRLHLKNVSVTKSNLIAIAHTGSGQVAYFNYPDTLFYNFETLIVGVGNSVIRPTTIPSEFITQNSFTVPLLNHATIKENGLVFHLNESYEILNDRSFFNIWLRNESGAGVNDIENLVGIAISFLGLLGYTLEAIALKYGIFATFEVN